MTMIALFALVVSVLAGFSSASIPRVGNNLMVTHQDVSGKGQVQNYYLDNGMQSTNVGPSFTFEWPLVEMTSDSNTGDAYVVTFPVDAPDGILFQLDRNLSTIYAWKNVPYSFFDLQYSPHQKTLYGIKVTSSYGRVLSNFVLDQAADSITATELYTLPYMWYVNASSFDPKNNRYFALINNFPGFENSTLDQQLVVADFSQGVSNLNPSVGLFPISSQGMLVQFVTYAHGIKTLFCAGINNHHAEVAILDHTTGIVGKVVFSKPAFAVGPLMYVPNHHFDNSTITVYVQTAIGAAPHWELWSFAPIVVDDVVSVNATLVYEYIGNYYTSFAAATVAYML